MAYIVNKSDGTVLTSVAPGTIDNSYGGLILIGKLYSGYGEALNENLVRLLENSAKAAEPDNPLLGQLWFDSSAKILKVCTYGGYAPTFKNVSSCTTSVNEPASPVDGDLWWNTDAKQLNVYDAASGIFVLVGPSNSTATGQTGALVASMNDSSGNPHFVIKEFAGDTLVAIVSKDAFTPSQSTETATNTNFPYIYAGYTLTQMLSNSFRFVGTSTNSDKLENLSASVFIRGNTSSTTNGTFAFTNVNGISIGPNTPTDLKISVTSGGDASITNQTTSGMLSLRVKKSSTSFELITLDPTPATPTVTINSGLTVNAPSKFIGDIVPDSPTGSYNLGNATTAFGTLYVNTLRSTGSANISLSSHMNPTSNNTIDLGGPTARYKTLFVSCVNAITASFTSTNLSSPTITGGTITGATITDSQIITASSITLAGSITPQTTNVYNAGSTSRLFNTVFTTYLGSLAVPTTLAYVNQISAGAAANITLSGNITPGVNAAYYLGTSGARFVTIHTTNVNTINASVTSNLTVGGGITTGTLTADTLTATTELITAGLTTSDKIMPSANGTIDLGSSTYRFKTIYATSIDATSASFTGTSLSNPEVTNGNITGANIITANITNSSITATSLLMLGNIIPNANTYTVGNTSRVFDTIYGVNLGSSGTPYTKAFINNITPSTGTLTIGGTAVPSANVTYNLGSAAARFTNVFTSNINTIGALITGNVSTGNINVAGTTTTNNLTAAGTTSIPGSLLLDGSVTTSVDLMPSANNTVNLGSSTFRFNTLYVSTLDSLSTTIAPGTNLNGAIISSSQIILANSITMAGSIVPNANSYTIGNTSKVFNTVYATNLGSSGTPIGIANLGTTVISGNNIELAASATGNRDAFIDFHSDDTYTDYSLRVISLAGANGVRQITARGTGGISIETEQAAGISFRPQGVLAATVNSAGNLVIANHLLTSAATGVSTIGNATNYFGNMFGTAMLARYADLAERYHSDAVYDSGTVVKLGGENEITQTTNSVDSTVFGVVSTDPGLILNSAAGDDDTHPLIALAGRVPCKVTGTVNKGDRLVSSDIPGVAKAYSTGDDVLAIIGRALVNKTSTEVELIEIVVGVK